MSEIGNKINMYLSEFVTWIFCWAMTEIMGFESFVCAVRKVYQGADPAKLTNLYSFQGESLRW